MRIALDIDSTLYHAWPLLEDAAQRLYGVRLRYEDQHRWNVPELGHARMAACVSDIHREHLVLAAEPYPRAVEIVRRWHAAGHFIHVTSHRSEGARAATIRWLERIGMPYDDLHCSFDKLARCAELEIELLIDDSPVNLRGALEQDIVAATIAHPWNRELDGVAGVIRAPDWRTLARRLEPLLAGTGARTTIA